MTNEGALRRFLESASVDDLHPEQILSLGRLGWEHLEMIISHTVYLANKNKSSEAMNHIKAVATIVSAMSFLAPDEHRGLSLRHILPQNRAAVAVKYTEYMQKLSADEFLFWTCADLVLQPLNLESEQELASMMVALGDYNHSDAVALANGFKSQLVDEARGNMPVLGMFVMAHEAFPQLDAAIAWESVRLIVRPHGIWVTFVCADGWEGFWWTPDDYPRTMLVYTRHIVDVFCAGLWRDLCVVREKFATASGNGRDKIRVRDGKRVVVLPRVHYVQWGHSDAEREHIRAVTHAVRAHYRKLADGWQTSAEAIENARAYNLPEPPAGFTFVKPHLRGEGEAEASAVRVVCRGLRTMKVALS